MTKPDKSNSMMVIKFQTYETINSISKGRLVNHEDVLVKAEMVGC